MANDPIPQSFKNLSPWLANLIAKLPTRGPQVNMTAAEITALSTKLQTVKGAVDGVLAAQSAHDVASATAHQVLDEQMPAVRKALTHIKTDPSYTAAIGVDLEIVGSGATFDPATYKPQIAADAFPGHVRITGKKLGADAFNLYSRLQGQTDFNLVIARRSRFPFDDDSALAMAGTPETREYMAMGVIADEEIGQPSDIVSVLYGG